MAAASSPLTDELDRLFRRLIRNLADLDPSRVHGPVEVAEIAGHLVPYRTHRTELAMDTHEDYEMTVLRLLAGERGYAAVEPAEARDAMERELASVNPDPAFFHKYPTARVTFDPGHVRDALGQEAPEAAAKPEPAAGPAPAMGDEAEERGTTWFPETPAGESEAGGEALPAGATDAELPFALDEEEPAEDAGSVSPRFGSAPCAYCGGALPIGRAVIFCPHCGQNVGVVHCPACGTELDVGWTFCITCGRRMTGLG